MRRQEFLAMHRASVFWYVIGTIIIQLSVAFYVDLQSIAVRDPEYILVESILKARRADRPTSPVILALGSSRTLYGLDAGWFTQSGGEKGPLVINGGMIGSGAILNYVALQRLLTAECRPDLILLEVLPMGLSARNGCQNEERWSFQHRYSASEVGNAWNCLDQPYRLVYRWGRARVLPCIFHHDGLRQNMGIDLNTGAHMRTARDAFGWREVDDIVTPAELARRVHYDISTNHAALTEPALSPGAVHASRTLLQRCRDAHIPVILVVPPESTAFRGHSPGTRESQVNAVRDLATEFNLCCALATKFARFSWVDSADFQCFR